jgi:hypothetical protein
MDVREQALSAMGIAELQVNQSSAPVHSRQSSPLHLLYMRWLD